MTTNLLKIILALFLIILFTNLSPALNITEYNNITNNPILNESLNSPINLTIFELTGTIIDKENNTKGNFSHYLIGLEFIENDTNTTTYIPFNEILIINETEIHYLIYDPDGNRLKKVDYDYSTGINKTTYYISDNFIQIRYTNGTILNETYYYANDKLLAKKDNSGNKQYYHPDHLGSTTLVTNQSGSIVEEEFYLPHGDVYSGSESSRYLYTSKELDKAIDLYYYGARYYQASIMRMFIQPDSIISDIYNPQSLNRYSYVLNNPYKYVDESGNIPVDVVVDVVFIGVGVYEFTQDPSLSTFGSLAADVAFAATPYLPNLKRIGQVANKATDLGKVDDAVKAGEVASMEKKIPNPFGSKGGPAHQAGVEKVKQDIRSRELGFETEVTIKDPITGKARRADAVGIQNSKITEIHQVGRETQGGIPVSRERRADTAISSSIERGAVGKKGGQELSFSERVKRFFHGYNKGSK